MTVPPDITSNIPFATLGNRQQRGRHQGVFRSGNIQFADDEAWFGGFGGFMKRLSGQSQVASLNRLFQLDDGVRAHLAPEPEFSVCRSIPSGTVGAQFQQVLFGQASFTVGAGPIPNFADGVCLLEIDRQDVRRFGGGRLPGVVPLRVPLGLRGAVDRAATCSPVRTFSLLTSRIRQCDESSWADETRATANARQLRRRPTQALFATFCVIIVVRVLGGVVKCMRRVGSWASGSADATTEAADRKYFTRSASLPAPVHRSDAGKARDFGVHSGCELRTFPVGNSHRNAALPATWAA